MSLHFFAKHGIITLTQGSGKGRIISEQNCGFLNFQKMQQNYC